MKVYISIQSAAVYVPHCTLRSNDIFSRIFFSGMMGGMPGMGGLFGGGGAQPPPSSGDSNPPPSGGKPPSATDDLD